MKTVGIICEYNPFHLGHQKQINMIRQKMEADCAIVCLMSGNFVQRGMPAIFDKSFRSQAAIDCGADLVLELPVNYALSSAEGFSAGGVKILSGFCDYLCFGTENGTADTLMATAKALLAEDFPEKLRLQLDKGLSFPAARQAALGDAGALLENPNDILAVEYCKAILSQGSAIQILPIHRAGSYHDTAADNENPSATAVRNLVTGKHDWKSFIPKKAHSVFSDAPVHTLAAGERAMLGKLRSMTDEEFEALPYGSEGLWRKFMHACRSCATLEDIIAATKSKRYTRTRIDRMVMCAYLGITKNMLETPAPYCRVLGFNSAGTAALKNARLNGQFPHIGEATKDPYEVLEQRTDDLYGLFREDSVLAAGQQRQRRVYIAK